MTPNIKYIDKEQITYTIENIECYVARTKTDKQLISDWEVTEKWYALSKKGKTSIPVETVLNFAASIFAEAQTRGFSEQLRGSEFCNETLPHLKSGMETKFINFVKEQEAFVKWSTEYINNLPDSAFAYIESGGTKDEEGKTKPRTLRHLPYRNAEGDIDMPHLRNALARLNQVEDKKGNKLTLTTLGLIRNKLASESVNSTEDFAMQKPFGHPAGKANQADQIIPLIPEHSIYVEPFSGSATIFYTKKPSSGKEVLNDLNPEVIKALRICKAITDEQIGRFSKKDWVASQATFDKLLKSEPSDDVDWLHRFIYITNNSWGKMRKQFSEPNAGSTMNFVKPYKMELIRKRMVNTTIESMDYLEAMKKYDSPDTFFYLDPPYYPAKDKRTVSMKVGEIDFAKMIEEFKKLKGKFIMSLGDDKPLLREFKKAGFQIKNIKNIRDLILIKGGNRRNWPLVSNFDMVKVGLYDNTEMLFEDYELDEPQTLNVDFDSIATATDTTSITSLDGTRMDLKLGSPIQNFYCDCNNNTNITNPVVDVQFKAPSGSVSPMTFFKPCTSTLDTDIHAIISKAGSSKQYYPSIVHEQFDGMRVQIHKHENTVKIYSSTGQDITQRFGEIERDARKIQADAFVLDAYIIGWSGGYKKGKTLSEHAIETYATKSGVGKGKHLYAHIIDLLYLDVPTYESRMCEDMHGYTTESRLTFLNALFDMTCKKHELEFIRFAQLREVNNGEELIEAVKFYSNANGSKGALIRPNGSFYSLNDTNELWLSFIYNKEAHTHDLELFSTEPDEAKWEKWNDLVNMSQSELKAFMDSEDGKKAGLTAQEAKSQGIDSGRESAGWLLKMIPSGRSFASAKENWTPTMWTWAGKQNSFISRMKGAAGPLYDDKGNKTRKYLSLLIWGHDPEKNTKHEENFMQEIHSIEHVSAFADNPEFIELTGILFHRGKHKKMNYKDADLERARLAPRPGSTIAYVNWYHNKGETYKNGILSQVWWDKDAEWYCTTNKMGGKGALRFRAVITEPTAINDVIYKHIGNVSAELRFQEYLEEGKLYASDIEVIGLAITSNPALPAADIQEACTMKHDGKRVCKTIK